MIRRLWADGESFRSCRSRRVFGARPTANTLTCQSGPPRSKNLPSLPDGSSHRLFGRCQQIGATLAVPGKRPERTSDLVQHLTRSERWLPLPTDPKPFPRRPRPPGPAGRRPVIGVTGPDHGGMAAWLFTWLAVAMAGGRAVWIRPSHPRRAAGLDGLIVGGGADVDPQLYGQTDHIPVPDSDPRHPWRRAAGLVLFPLIWLGRKLAGQFATSGRDGRRDALELRLIDEAVRRGLPILGICRGEQLLNVYFGGSLHQSLKGFYVEDPETRSVLPRKAVTVAAGSRLGVLVGDGLRRVNALHYQAIDRLGSSLRVAARDRNGIVQAIEHETLPFVVGIQWHPEYLPQLPRQRQIFQGLVEAARAAAASDGPIRVSAVLTRRCPAIAGVQSQI